VSARPVACAALLAVVFAAPANAQFPMRPDAPQRGSWEVGGGGVWGSSVEFGERRAQQTRNPTTGTGAFDLFVTDSTLEASPGAQAHLAFYLTRAIAIEAGVRYAQPRLRVRLSGDAEEADPIAAEETIAQYQFDGSLVVHLTNFTFADGRAVPFVAGGAGHIRDLHQGNELVETGTEFHGGGGLKWWFGAGRRRLGLRVEGRVTSREGGFGLGEDRRTVPSGGVSLAYLF
jgi:hypothetical protein